MNLSTSIHLSSLRRVRLINWVALALALLWLVLVATTLAPDADDSKQFWWGAVDLLQHGDPYASRRDFLSNKQPQTSDVPSISGYKYTPIFAYLTQPLGLLSSQQNQWVWFGINSVALAGLIWLCIRCSGSGIAQRYWGLVALGTVIAPPTRLSLQLGQTSIVLALLQVGCYALARRHNVTAGFSLALASLVKLYPALLGFFFLLRRPRAVARWSAALAAALVGLFISFYGVAHYDSFLRTVVMSGDHPYGAEFNISLLGFWTRLFTQTLYSVPVINQPQIAKYATLLTSCLVLGVCAWVGRGTANAAGRLLEFGVWLCATLLLSPINGTYNLVLLLMPLLGILRYLEQHPDRAVRNWLVLGTALLCVPAGWSSALPALYNRMHTGWGVLLLTPSFYGLLIYLVLLAILARRCYMQSGLIRTRETS